MRVSNAAVVPGRMRQAGPWTLSTHGAGPGLLKLQDCPKWV